MCGIAGIWTDSQSKESSSFLIKRMTDSLSHRGPDGEGFWHNKYGNVHFGHRRLSIIDLSENAKQPMHFENRFTITFNGEIYNYIELRETLVSHGIKFKTSSDTEVVLASYSLWKEKCLDHFDGMFAFAIYDNVTHELFCARDRYGEKPFYYAIHDGNLVFASEIKALWEYGIPKNPNDKLFFNYLEFDLVENPHDQRETFYSNIYKLKSAHYFIYSGGLTITQKKYYSISIEQTCDDDISTASNRLYELLSLSTKRRLRSDVPIGSSLSGGLDSSSIVALISAHSHRNHTVSARFKNFNKDEGKYIDIVSKEFNTIHHNVFIDENSLLEDLDKLIYHQEEPFQTGSIYAQYCVYKEARANNLTVMLDGQGADEYLCGYDKDFSIFLFELSKQKNEIELWKDQLYKNHNIKLELSSLEMLKYQFPTLVRRLSQLKFSLLAKSQTGLTNDFFQANKNLPFQQFGSLKETLKYEMDNQGLEKLLRFADRNSMAHSVEVRLPFLYHELIDYIFSLKSSLFLEQGWSKAILRQAMKQKLPNEICFRKDKIGFEAPHDKWTANNQLNEMFQDAHLDLVNKKIITADYKNRWKTIIASKFLN